MGVDSLLDSILKDISLDKIEIEKIRKNALEIQKILKKAKFDAEIGGSLAKGTLVKKKNQDVDIFVTLDEKKLKDFEKLIKKTNLEYSVIHGSRDYLTVEREDIIFEIIPVLKFKNPDEANNTTDFSLSHVKYIKKKISKDKKLADEIRLAKAFCYAQDCYGAESYIGGFSGYALEVLVCYFGSFMKFIKLFSREKIIDPEKQFKNKNEILRELNQNKLQSPIILIDPTYKYRNICAGLTQEKFDSFLKASQAFLKAPSKEYFDKKEFDLENLKNKVKTEGLVLFELNIRTDRQEGDIAGTKMKKFSNFIKRELERKKQQVIYFQFVYNDGQDARAYFAVKEVPEIEIIGPKEDMKKAVIAFKKVRKQVYISKGFVCAKEAVNIEDIFQKQVPFSEGMGVGFDWRKIG